MFEFEFVCGGHCGPAAALVLFWSGGGVLKGTVNDCKHTLHRPQRPALSSAA